MKHLLRFVCFAVPTWLAGCAHDASPVESVGSAPPSPPHSAGSSTVRFVDALFALRVATNINIIVPLPWTPEDGIESATVRIAPNPLRGTLAIELPEGFEWTYCHEVFAIRRSHQLNEMAATERRVAALFPGRTIEIFCADAFWRALELELQRQLDG